MALLRALLSKPAAELSRFEIGHQVISSLRWAVSIVFTVCLVAATVKSILNFQPTTVGITQASRLARDILPEGQCRSEAARYCAGVPPGDQRLLHCLLGCIEKEKIMLPKMDLERLSDKCVAEVAAFQIEMYKDMALDVKMSSACKEDISSFCDPELVFLEPGSVLGCLRETQQLTNMSDACEREVFRAKLAAAQDFRMDPQVYQWCTRDARRLCKGVAPGDGAVLQCLRGRGDAVSWECQAELFRQEVENTGDFRLNLRLHTACLRDAKSFCADISPGKGRIIDCLEDHARDPKFSAGCRVEMEKLVVHRAQDYRLDFNLRRFCRHDIGNLCHNFHLEIPEGVPRNEVVVECLRRKRQMVTSGRCRVEVEKHVRRGLEDIRMDPPLHNACSADLKTFCKDVPSGQALALKCLLVNEPKLQKDCRRLLERRKRQHGDSDVLALSRAVQHSEMTAKRVNSSAKSNNTST